MNPFRVPDPNLPDRMAHGLCALAVMTKAPEAGRVKTRLVPPLTPEEAAELNKCFLRDTAATISTACSRRLMGYAGNRRQTRHSHASHSEAATAAWNRLGKVAQRKTSSGLRGEKQNDMMK